MATPTSRLKLKKQTLGSNLNQWGLSGGLNGVFDQVDVLAGYLEVNLGSATSYTFGTTNYATTGNEHMYRAVKFSGSPASGVTVNIPAVDDFKFVENATGQTITFSNGATTATLANTFTGYIRTNGSSVITVLTLPDGVNVKTVADNIANVNTTATNISNVNTVAGISANVTTTAGISGNVTTVAGVASDVTGVAGISSAVTGVNAIASAVTAVNTDPLKTNIGNVSGNATNINAVAGNATNINTVAGINANVTTVAGISSDVTGVNAIASNVTTVAGVAPNVTTVAGVASNVTTVAGISSDVTGVNAISSAVTGVNAVSSAVTGVNAIASAVTAVNTDPLKSNINTTAGAVTNVNNVGTNIANVNSVASNMASVNSFGNTYQISTNNPTTGGDGSSSLADGMLAWVTSADKLRVYNATSGAWEDAGSAVNGTSARFSYTATANQTTFPSSGSISYDAGFADVYLNGIKLQNGTDVTVTSGTNVVLASGAAVGDIVDIVAYGSFNVSNTYTQAETNTLLADKAPLASPNFSGTPQIGGVNIATTASIPASGLTSNFVAQGNIGAGVAVGLRSDGKVEVITGSSDISSDPVVFDSSGVHVEGITSYFDPDENRVIVIYRDSGNSNYTTAIAGTPSGTTIAFNGSPAVLNNFDAQYFSSCYDSVNSRGIVVNRRVDNANLYQKMTYALTVSGDTITSQGNLPVGGQGSDQASKFLNLSYDTAQAKALFTFRDPSTDGGGVNFVRGMVLTMRVGGNYYDASGSGGGNADNIGSYNNTHSKIGTDYNATAACHLVPYKNGSNQMTCRVVTISSGAIVLGTEIADTSQTNRINERVVAIAGTSNFLYAGYDVGGSTLLTRVISVSGTTPTYHTINTGRQMGSTHLRPVFDPDQGKAVVFFDDYTTGLGKMRGITISGTTVTEDATDIATSTGSKSSTAFTETRPVYDTTNNRIVVSGRTSESPQQGISKICKLGETNNGSFIGISNASATNGNTVTVTIKGGVASNLTGLTVLSDYYVQADGTLSTVTGSPAIKIGTALAATKLGMIGFS